MNLSFKERILSRLRNDFDLSIITILVCLVLITLTPFALVRFIRAEYFILFLDLAVMLVALGILAYCLASRNTDRASVLLISAITASLGIASYVNPKLAPYWLYCVVLFNFALATPNKALFFVLLGFATVTLQSGAFDNETVRSTYTVTCIATILFAYIFALRNEQQKRMLMSLARTDPLTGVANRRAFDEDVTRAIHTLERDSAFKVAIASLDIDYFKMVNDNFGHEVGDDVLIGLVTLLTRNIRKTDRLFRIGGEEFCVVLNQSDERSAKIITEKLCTLVRSNPLTKHQTITVSIGATCLKKDDTAESWIKRADSALYTAKSQGRSRVIIE